MRRLDAPPAGPPQLRRQRGEVHRERARSSSPAPLDRLGRDRGRSELHFAVSDTGIGIPATVGTASSSPSPRSTPRRRAYGGTGLGLAISRRLCELMGGRSGSRASRGRLTSTSPPARTAPLPSPRWPIPELLERSSRHDNRRTQILLQMRSWDRARRGRSAPRRSSWSCLASSSPSHPRHAHAGNDASTSPGDPEAHDARALPLAMLTSLGFRDDDPRMARVRRLPHKPVKASQLYTPRGDVRDRVAVARSRAGNAPRPTTATDPPRERLPLRILLAEDNSTTRSSRSSSSTTRLPPTSPPTGSRRSRPWSARSTTWSSWTSRCRRWTASKRRDGSAPTRRSSPSSSSSR